MNFSPIKRLRLKTAYQDQQKFSDIACDADYLAELFEWTDRGLIFIHDDSAAGHSRFVADTNGLGADKTLKVENRNHREMFLWHIDGVLYKKDSKCDCALLSDSRLSFIEFKSNAANNTETATKENYKKATSQLKLTLEDVGSRCHNAGVDLKAAALVDAYAVFNRTVPAHSAYQKKLAAQFLKETKGVSLYFRNKAEI